MATLWDEKKSIDSSPKMKTILLFINTLSSGGAEHQLVELAEGLVERGYEVTITTFGDVEDHYCYNDAIHRYRIAKGKNRVIKMMGIWKYFCTVKTDWVIAFGQRESSYCLQGLMFRPKRTVHIIAGDRNTTHGSSSCVERLLMRCLYRRADYIVPNSHTQRRHIVSTNIKLESKTVTITNYTDLSIFTATTLPNNDVLRIGVFSRYDVQKNYMRFVEAVNLLKKKSQQLFVIEWYGNQRFKDIKPNPHYLRMKEKVLEYGLQDVLILNNHVKDVASIMPRFDAICLPSLWEGFSNSISEAICCGNHCLVSDVADNGILVKDGENGLLFDPNSEESMVEAFLKFFALLPEEKQRMGDFSRKRAESLFDKERFVDAYIELIESK